MFLVDAFIVALVALVINIFVILNKDERKKTVLLIKEKLKKIKGKGVKK